MSNCKKITIHQNAALSTTGHAPLCEPFEYYLDIDGIIPSNAQEFIRENRSSFPFIDDDAIATLSEESDRNFDTITDIGVQLAQHVIARRHTELPASLGFGMHRIDSLDGVQGSSLECFGMTLVEQRKH